jgi:hypothetical protein
MILCGVVLSACSPNYRWLPVVIAVGVIPVLRFFEWLRRNLFSLIFLILYAGK